MSFYVDDTLIGTQATSNPFGGAAMFGAGGVQTLYIGGYGAYADGVYTPTNEVDQLVGRTKYFQMYDYAMNAAEVAAAFNGRDQLTGSETGLTIFYKMDEGSGTTLTNLGSAGSKYDGILGEYASAESVTTAALGNSDLQSCDVTYASEPMWVNNAITTNTRPVADNATFAVSSPPTRREARRMLALNG